MSRSTAGMSDPVATAVAGSWLGAALTPAQAQQIATAPVRRFRRGQVVFSAEDPVGPVLIVISGRLSVIASTADGKDFQLAALGAGDTVGEISALDGQPRSATVVAVEPTVALAISRDAFGELLADSPRMSSVLLVGLAGLVRRLTGAAADLALRDLPHRLARMLLQEADGGTEVARTTVELAHMVGGSRQSVSSALHCFERRGWLRIERGRVHLVRVDALGSYAAFQPLNAPLPTRRE